MMAEDNNHEYVHQQYLMEDNYCESCQRIPWENMLREVHEQYIARQEHYFESSRYVMPGIIPLNEDPAYKHSCSLCQLVWTLILSSQEHISPQQSVYIMLSSVSLFEVQTLPFVRAQVKYLDDNGECRSFTAGCDVLLSGSFARSASNARITTVTESPQAWKRIRDWIDICDETHQNCGDPTDQDSSQNLLPARLLSIGQENAALVRLTETTELPNLTQYCALSHCWGTQNAFKTCNDNIAAHTNGIEISTLPRTFQDAIAICKQLSVRYIWIDSLCIVQDSVEDWETESAKMGSVYKNAYFTIAASRAAGDHEGSLGMRKLDTSLYENHMMQVCEPVPGFLIGNEGATPLDSINDCPLSQRAWVAQERCLARRTVFFTEFGLCWSCCTIAADERGRRQPAALSNIINMLENIDPRAHGISKASFPLKARSQLSQNSEAGRDRYLGWYLLIEKYSACSITKKGDRLPAISGLATEIIQRTHEKYYAGIWENDVIQGLSWQVSTESQRSRNHEYIAPSWSWVSTNSRILVRRYPAHTMQVCATIESIAVTPKGLNLQGEVTEGSLIFSAPTLRITGHGVDNNGSGLAYVFAQTHDKILKIRAGFDYIEPRDVNNMCLAILSFGFRKTLPRIVGNPLVALILVPDEGGLFRRVGLSLIILGQGPLEDLSAHEIPREASESSENVMKSLVQGLPESVFTVL